MLGDQYRGLVIDRNDDRPRADLPTRLHQPGDQAVRSLAAGGTGDEPAAGVARDSGGRQPWLGDRVDRHPAPAQRAEHPESARVHRVLADLQHQGRHAAVERDLARSLLDPAHAITLNRSTTAISSSRTTGTQAKASGRISQRLAGRHSLTSSRATSSTRPRSSIASPMGVQIVVPEYVAAACSCESARGALAGSMALYTAAPGLFTTSWTPGSAAIAARKLRSQRG